MKTQRAVGAFYLVVLATALAGSTTAAAGWLHTPWYVAVVPVAAVELGGVVLMLHAQERREMGETALAARILSAAVATGAVAVNGLGHQHPGQAGFFGGMSALGYAVYLLIAAASRRDALRAAGMLPPAAPVYGLMQWARHPWLTRRARRLALATPTLGLYGSLDAATAAVRAEKREAAIARALDGLIRRTAGPVMADIAVHTYDPAQIARLIAEGADYEGYARLIGRDLTPDRLAGEHTGTPQRDDLTALMDATAPTTAELVEQAVTRHLTARPMAAPTPPPYRPRLVHHDGVPRAHRAPAKPPAIHVTVVAPSKPTRPATDTASGGRSKPARPPATTETRVAGALARRPDMTQADVAKMLGIGERTVRRYWPRAAAIEAVNGSVTT